jgi:uncharacterized membrane protein
MVDPTVADIGAWTAVGISAGLLLLAWVFYDIACRVIRSDRNLMLVLAGAIVLTAWGTSELFTARAAWLQTGAMLGTIMAGSVFFNIIPAHWELIRAKEAGRDPDPAPGIAAKRRSVHNNYFTLPVLVTMLAGHFTFMIADEYAWILLVCLMALGAFIRHFYNLRHGGNNQWWMWAAATAVVIVMFVVLYPEDQPAAATTSAAATEPAVSVGAAVFETAACGSCHTLAAAGSDGKAGPSLDAAKPDQALTIDRVTNGRGGMPAFKGQLDEDEIAAVAAYVSGAAGE